LFIRLPESESLATLSEPPSTVSETSDVVRLYFFDSYENSMSSSRSCTSTIKDLSV